MTFYWWSHWFWITVLSVILLLVHITHVHTYPSQEISLDHNQQQQEQTQQEDNDKSTKTVTKLYQTTASVAWATAAPNRILKDYEIDNVNSNVNVNAKLRNALKVTEALGETIVTQTQLEQLQEQEQEEEEQLQQTTVEPNFEIEWATELQNNESNTRSEYQEQEQQDQQQAEYKRSAETLNQTSNEQEQQSLTATAEKLQDAEMIDASQQNIETGIVEEKAINLNQRIVMEKADISNYTNFSSNAVGESLNSSTNNDNQAGSITNNQLVVSAAPPATPRIDIKNVSAIELAKVIAQLPQPSHVTVSVNNADNAEIPPNNVQKVPFTLENANKEEELRRAENEHRSRKSKVLSADYKSINRYINYSTDSKSLLTRSASTAPNDFEDDASNISSEALSVQRTYFMDASTISAICFTVFGICCTVGTIGLVFYRRRYLLNKPQTLSEPDSSVYIDDSTIRDNSDEMYSLDNDSFLNSLEAMTIQNYWTDTVKHTKL